MASETLDDVRARLAALEDRQRLADLILDYCRGVDRCDDALLRATYWPDAIDDHGAGPSNAMAFCDRVIPLLREHAVSTMHLVANSRIVLDGDRAHGETYVVASHVLKSAHRLDIFVGAEAAQAIRDESPSSAWDGPFEYNAGARYLDRFERRGGEWRFAYRGLAFDWVEARPASIALSLLNRARGRRDATDPSYAILAGG